LGAELTQGSVLELYHNNMSVCAQKVRLVLREKGLRPIEHHLNLRAGDATRPEYLKLNPNGVIPTLIDQGVAIIESTVICEYLEDAYPQPPLRPIKPLPRAAMRAWTLRPDAGLHHACGITTFAIAFRHQMLALPPEEIERQISQKPDSTVRDNLRQTIALGVQAPQVANALKVYNKMLGQLSSQLSQSAWVAGDEYSLADVAILPYVCRLEDLALSWLWDGERGCIASWLNRCKARANFSGIADYLDPGYLELMRKSGLELAPDIRRILSAA
jgi:glutathione S-transferase